MSKHIQSFTEQLIGTVLKDMFIYYRGRVIQHPTKDEYIVGSNTFATLEEAQKQVDLSYSILQHSIK